MRTQRFGRLRSFFSALAVWLVCNFDVAWSKPQTEAPAKVECGAVQLSVVTERLAEDTVAYIRFIGSGERAVFPTISWPGTFVSLCSRKVFVLLDTSVHYRPGTSFLMTSEGGVVATFELGEIAAYGASPDQKLFWVQVLEGVDHPTTTLSVFDSRGALVLREAFSTKSEATVEYESERYSIAILKPEPPG